MFKALLNLQSEKVRPGEVGRGSGRERAAGREPQSLEFLAQFSG